MSDCIHANPVPDPDTGYADSGSCPACEDARERAEIAAEEEAALQLAEAILGHFEDQERDAHR